MLRTLVHGVSTRFLVLALVAGAAVGFAPPTTAQTPQIQPLPTDDLVTRVDIMPEIISPGGNAVVTVRVEHHDLSLLPHPIGASVQNVSVVILLTPLLQQVGNIIAGGGFLCSPPSGPSQTMYCNDGTIPWGSSVDILFEVISTEGVCDFQGVLARVDPFNRIFEIKGNNVAGATAYITCIN